MYATDQRHRPSPRSENCLSAPERTLLCAFRWWLAGASQRDLAANERARLELAALVGAAPAQIILGHFDVMIRTVARHPARIMRYHPPWCRAPSQDELLLLAMTAACQGGHGVMGRALARLVSSAGGAPMVYGAAEDLAQAILAAGIVLPLTAQTDSARSLSTLGLVTLH